MTIPMVESIAQNSQDSQDYRVHLDLFEGPLDLLLHLIKKEEVDIYDIPIARLLGGYLEYVELARELNIDLAGDFLEMAAELTYIKSKMLLPEPPEEIDAGPDPRAELVARLLEYQRYKVAAERLMERPLLSRDVFVRASQSDEGGTEEELLEIDSITLLSAFQDILKRVPAGQIHEIRQPLQGVAERVIELTDRLKGVGEIAFEGLFEGVGTRTEIVVTFLALLEMAKQGLVRIFQIGEKIFVCPLFSATKEGEDYGLEDDR